jgi:AcrR family transcriptional regulator
MNDEIKDKNNQSLEGKEEVFFKICNSVLKKEVEKGHLKWTVSDISRDADVTRSLVYYYFGKEKQNIFDEAWRYMISIFFSFSEETKQRPINERMHNILGSMKKMPYLFVLFFLKKNEDTPIAQEIRKAEEGLLDILQKEYPAYTRTQVLRLYLLELGSIAYGLDPEKANEVFDFPRQDSI